jgi:RNA polymerase sigma-70 factor, ECF subfamily
VSNGNPADSEVDAFGFFDLLFRIHHDAVVRYCVRRLGLTEAEDAAADVFAVAWRRLDEVPRGDEARAWLIGVAYKVVGNKFRSRHRGVRLSQRLEFTYTTSPSPPVMPEMDTELIHLALGELSRTDRELIRLTSWDGFSRVEIAQVLGIRVNAVDQRLHRARTRLKAHFDRLVSANTASRAEEASL